MSEYPTRTMLRFLDDVKELVKKYGILQRDSFIQHDVLGTYIDIHFRIEHSPDLLVNIGRPKSLPDLRMEDSFHE